MVGSRRKMAAPDRPRTPARLLEPPRSWGVLQPLAVALAASAGAVILLLLGHRLGGGLVALVGAGALLLGSAGSGRSPRRDRLALLVVDRVFDGGILAAVAWVTRQASPRASALALFGLGVSFLASYERARAEALGLRGFESFEYRLGRVALLVLALLTGAIEAFLWLFVAIAAAAAAARWWNARRQVRAR